MFQLVYASKARRGLSEDELAAILTKARKNNSGCGITGVLLYMNGAFLQVLEGEEPVVRALFETIRQDSRHEKVRGLLAQPIIKPVFRDWAMGFAQVPAGIVDETGFFKLTQEALEETLDEERAQILFTLIGRLADEYGQPEAVPSHLE